MQGEKGSIHLDETISEFDCTIQNCLVNLGTTKGSDTVFLEKGTKLFARALAGVMINQQEADHTCNFAALDTLFFTNEYDPNIGQERLQDFRLQPQSFNNFRLKAQVQIKTSTGRVIGISTSL